MGLFDKLTQAFTPEAPDYVAAITAASNGEEIPLATASVAPAAYKRSGSGGSAERRIVGAAISGVLNVAAKSKHLGGEPGSTALQLDMTGDFRALSIGETHVSWWDFGMTANESPRLVQRIPRGSLASIVDTGKKPLGGGPIARFTFTDDSYADYQVITPSESFFRLTAPGAPAA